MQRISLFLAIGLLFVGCGGGDGDERSEIRQAVQDWKNAHLEREAEAVCRKTFSSAFLPPRLARAIHVPPGEPGTPRGWERDYRECRAEFGDHGEFEDFRPKTIRVRRIRMGPADQNAGISATAVATVVINGRSEDPSALQLVKFRDDWKVIFSTN